MSLSLSAHFSIHYKQSSSFDQSAIEPKFLKNLFFIKNNSKIKIWINEEAQQMPVRNQSYKVLLLFN
jgi:hypothetical protein